MDKNSAEKIKKYIQGFLKKARSESQYSIQEASQVLNISSVQLEEYETGVKSPPSFLLIRIIHGFHADPLDFHCGLIEILKK